MTVIIEGALVLTKMIRGVIMEMQEILNGIHSRSKLLSRQYGCQYEDLFQDGIVHLLSYQKKNPNASFKQVMKSINYKYRDFSKKLRTRKRRNVSLESLPESFSSYEMEEQLIRHVDQDRMEKSLKEREDVEASAILLLTSEFSLPLNEVRKMLGLSNEEMYSRINEMKRGGGDETITR